ncbi:MAG: Rid family detoxifying hydrolase [Parvularculaceae bacterium]|nr:Rid family detoxifying hydrolase [Parvularculaceae bacterium]
MRKTVDVAVPQGLPFSAAVWAGDLLYVSGQVGLDPQTSRLVEGVAAQTATILRNVEAVLRAAGKSLDDVVKCNIYLSSMSHYAAMNEAYAAAFGKPFPARTCVAVAALPLSADVEIEVIAR